MSKYDLSIQSDIKAIRTRLEYLISKQSKVELKAIRNSRSVKHNAYLHVCITLFSIEFGYTLMEGKTLLKRECSFMMYEKNGIKFLKETKKMDSKELASFVEWIRNYASEQGLYIPDADEYRENKFMIDRDIEKNNLYL